MSSYLSVLSAVTSMWFKIIQLTSFVYIKASVCYEVYINNSGAESDESGVFISV